MGRSNESGTELVHAGFGNFVAANRVLAVVTPGSAPIQRMIRDGKRKSILIDMTSGHRSKAAVFTDTGHIVLVAITPEALTRRVLATRAGRADRAAAD